MYDEDGYEIAPVVQSREVRICNELRPLDYVKHQTLGECRVLTGNPSELTLYLKDRFSEKHIDIPVREIEVYGFDRREELFGTRGGWVKSAPSLTSFLKPQQAHFLSFLINWHWTRGKKHEWFFCRDLDIVEFAYLPPYTVTRLFNFMREENLLLTEVKGLPSKRFIRINYKLICTRVKEGREQWETRLKGWKRDYDHLHRPERNENLG